jgi:multicomponent Na+:H+ antiporter subunit D
MICFTVGSLSMIGIPMFGGFVSKWYIVSGALSISNWFVISVIIISTLLNTAYFIPIIYKSFSQGQSSVSYKKVPNSMLLATIASACLTVIIFLFPEFFIEVAKNVI